MVFRSLSLWLIMLASALFSIHSTYAQDSNLAHNIEEYLDRWHEVDRFHGSVLVALENEVILRKSYGLAHREWNIPNTPDTRYRLQSISKQFTTVLIFQLAAEGKLHLDDVITEHIPEYRADTGNRITIDHLLRHTSGIPCYIINGQPRTNEREPFNWSNVYTRDDLIATYMSGDLQFEPGSRYRYCNTGYFLLAVIIERVTGQIYEQVLQENILEPLDLDDPGIDSHERIIPHRAEGYVRSPRGYVRPRFERQQNLLGTGNLYSTVDDLYTWNQVLSSGAFLPEEWRKRMFTVYWRDLHEAHAYSINVFTMQLDTGEEITYRGFTGGAPGFMTDAFTFPDANLTVILLDNSSQYNHWRIAPDIYRIVRGFSCSEPKRLVSTVLAKIAVEESANTARVQHELMREHHADQFAFGGLEQELNGLGYQALAMEMASDAIAIFTLNTLLFPDSWNVYDSLAEAYQNAGNVEESTQLYTKAHRIKHREDDLLDLITADDYEKANAELRKIRLDNITSSVFTPARIGPLFGRAFESGDYVKALAICEVWALGNPNTNGPYFSMMRIFGRTGDLERAKACCDRIVQMDPDAPAAARAIEMLKQLVDSPQ